jgi:penicillin G amidase
VAEVDELLVAGVDDEIVVHRDEWGIPHVRARTAHDAFFGHGFVQATDRLGQLEYDRRRALGRWAEVAGASAVPFDAFARRCDLAGAAVREADALTDDTRGVLEAYAAGINAYLALDRPLPPDLVLVGVTPDLWTAADSCAVFLVRHVVFANWQKKLWRGRLVAALGPDVAARIEGAERRAVPLIVPPPPLAPPPPLDATALEPMLPGLARLAETVSGSNAWALSGTRTASGRPLLAGDPHRMLEVPGVYAQAHLACDEFDAIGLAFVGVPGFPHFGHTERVAWCVTNANGDYQDLYVEDPGACTSTGRAVIAVRDGDDVAVDCYASERGPVVFGDPSRGAVLSLRSTALAEPSTGLAVLGPMLTARDVDELDDVMREWVDPVNNFVSADVAGNIAYRTVGRIPMRDGATAWGPVLGDDPRYAWSGVVPHDDLPRLRNPADGLIVTANQRIIDPSEGQRLGIDYARPDRAIRLHARLDELHDATVEDMAAVHRDRRTLGADVWVPKLLEPTPKDRWEGEAQERLAEWDRAMDPDSVGAAVYVVVRDAACRLLAHHPGLADLRSPIADEPPGTFQPLELRIWAVCTPLLAAGDPTLLGSHRSWADLLAASLTDGVAVLRTRLGDDVDRWHWGALHRAAPRHPLGLVRPEWAATLDPPGIDMGGEWDTVMCAAHPAGHGYGVTSTSVARYVFAVGDWDDSRWIVPLGASGDPTSAHFADQQVSWATGELVPMRYSWDVIRAHATETQRLRAR